MWKYTAFLILALLAACAEMPPSSVVSIPGAPPKIISMELASQVEYKPYSPEVLASPAVQSLIAQCEQLGGRNCGEETVPANSRTKFVRSQDDKLWAFVLLGGLEWNREYAVRFRLFDPDRNLRSRVIASIHTPAALPPDFKTNFYFFWSPPDPPRWQLGQWRIEIFVNGQVELERNFLVVDQIQ